MNPTGFIPLYISAFFYFPAIQHILHGKEVFTDTTIRGKLGVNAVKANRSIYDHVVCFIGKSRNKTN